MLMIRRRGGPTVPLWILAVALLALGACRGTVPIGRLLDDPARYDGETVRVKGRVTSAVGALGRGAYRLNDGTGTLNVVSEEHGAPREGARVGVEGLFQSVFTLGDQTGAVLREKRRFDP
jgi:DNA/RNA endonuclease YhcR with UshA esterase domain